MIRKQRSTKSAHYVTAGRQLLEGQTAAQADRSPRTTFVASTSADRTLTEAIMRAAVDVGKGAVILRFAGNGKGPPNRADAALVHDGEPMTVRDCVLWSEEHGPMLLVPADACDEWHLAIGADGLKRRCGRPAAMLGKGMNRAKVRIERLARSLAPSDLNSTITILQPDLAA